MSQLHALRNARYLERRIEGPQLRHTPAMNSTTETTSHDRILADRARGTSAPAFRPRSSSSRTPTAPASPTSTDARSSTSQAASAARTRVTGSRPSSTRSRRRPTTTCTSASWSASTSRTSRSAAASPSCRPAPASEQKSLLAQLGCRGDRERRQDRPLGDRPARRRRLRQRVPRPHAADDDDDGQGEAVQGGVRAVRARGVSRTGAEPLPRYHDRRRDRGPEAALQGGGRPGDGRVRRARAGAG